MTVQAMVSVWLSSRFRMAKWSTAAARRLATAMAMSLIRIASHYSHWMRLMQSLVARAPEQLIQLLCFRLSTVFLSVSLPSPEFYSIYGHRKQRYKSWRRNRSGRWYSTGGDCICIVSMGILWAEVSTGFKFKTSSSDKWWNAAYTSHRWI